MCNKEKKEELEKKLRDAVGFIMFSIGNWDSGGYSSGNCNADSFFKMAIENIEYVVNDKEYKPIWLNRDTVLNFKEEYKRFNRLDGLLEVKKLMANGIIYVVNKEIGNMVK